MLTYLEMMRRYAVVAEAAAAGGGARAGADAVAVRAVGQPGHAGAAQHRGPADRVAGARGRAPRDRDIAAHIPDPADGLTHYEHAIELALTRIRHSDVPTRWSDAGRAVRPAADRPRLVRRQRLHRRPRAGHRRRRRARCGRSSSPSAASTAGTRSRSRGRCAAGSTGSPAAPGLRRGRRDPRRLHTGEALDWWRVERLDRPNLLRLRAEMRVPGRAWLELSADAGRGRRRGVPAAGDLRAARARRAPVLEVDRARSTTSSSAAWPATSPAPQNTRRRHS